LAEAGITKLNTIKHVGMLSVTKKLISKNMPYFTELKCTIHCMFETKISFDTFKKLGKSKFKIIMLKLLFFIAILIFKINQNLKLKHKNR
jgi:hypothetical protein